MKIPIIYVLVHAQQLLLCAQRHANLHYLTKHKVAYSRPFRSDQEHNVALVAIFVAHSISFLSCTQRIWFLLFQLCA